MKPTTSSLILLAAATASASGLKAPLQGIANAAQSPFGGKREKSLAISARDDFRISHRAESAEAYLSIRACDAGADKAKENGERFQSDLRKILTDAGLKTTVTSPTTVKRSQNVHYVDSDEYALSSRRRHGGKMKWFDTEEEDDEKHCASSSILVLVHDVDLISVLDTKPASDTGAHARIERIDWQLSEATKAAQKSELRRKAVNILLETGKDYAAAFGVDEFVPMALELQEEYTYDEVRPPKGHRRRYEDFDMDEDSTDLSVPDIEIFMDVGCKLTN